jgi:integrase/recombinase XerD
MKLHLEKNPTSRVRERKRHFLSFCEEFNVTPIGQLGKNEISAWFQKIKEKYDLSDRTLNTIKSDLNAFFHFLEDENIIVASPLSKVKFERKPPTRRPRVVLSVDEVHKILENAKIYSPKILYPFLFVAAYTGARSGEVRKLKRSDIDFESGLIHFRKTKNGEDRSLRISGQLSAFLKQFLGSHDSEIAFPYENGQMIPNHIIERHLKRFRKTFPIGKAWAPHALRHSFAYNFLKMGRNMYQLQAILGHKSIDVTVDVYGQIGAQDIENPCPYDQIQKEII